ncbi:MAG: hypothetical protein HYY93_15220 [Planctomycetes bacterium]|nr:hypothetical protein [Planctomycetota bacterium]
MELNSGVLALWAGIGLLALGRAWGDPDRRRRMLGAAAALGAAGAAACGLWQFCQEPHEWAEATLALGGMSGMIVLAGLASVRGGAADGK